jgi:hypothetical protein
MIFASFANIKSILPHFMYISRSYTLQPCKYLPQLAVTHQRYIGADSIRLYYADTIHFSLNHYTLCTNSRGLLSAGSCKALLYFLLSEDLYCVFGKDVAEARPDRSGCNEVPK